MRDMWQWKREINSKWREEKCGVHRPQIAILISRINAIVYISCEREFCP